MFAFFKKVKKKLTDDDSSLQIRSSIVSAKNSSSVTYSIELRSYLKSLALLSKLNSNPKSTVQELEEAIIKKNRFYKNLFDYLSGLPGATIWNDIRKLFLKNNFVDPQIKKFALNQHSGISLVTEAMKDSCIEIIKNSIDAFIDHYLLAPDTHHTRLDIVFCLRRERDELELKITDNAHGFPKWVIDKYMKLINNEIDFSFFQKESYKIIEKNKYFGGAGRGLLQLIARICYKSDLIGRCALKQLYESPTKSSMTLSNTQEGACLVLRSKLKPLQKVQDQCSLKECLENEFELTLPIGRFK
jgi:hypothetical protein